MVTQIQPKIINAYECSQCRKLYHKPDDAIKCTEDNLKEYAKDALMNKRIELLQGIEEIFINEMYTLPKGRGLFERREETPEQNYAIVADNIIRYLAKHPSSQVKSVQELEKHKPYIIRRLKEWTISGSCDSGARWCSDTITTYTGAMTEGAIYYTKDALTAFAPGV